MPRCVVLALALVLGSATVAQARTITAHVFDAADRAPVAGAVVSVGLTAAGVTDEHGEIVVEADPGIVVWVRVPEGFTPGPVAARVDLEAPRVELALHRLAAPPSSPLVFVAASDVHESAETPFWDDLGDASLGATARAPAPAFFTILGDVTGNALPKQFAAVTAQLAGLDVPFVPVPGNHDWYDGGGAWLAQYVAGNYSFDIGGVHFIVWNMAIRDDQLAAFVASDLERVPPETTVVGLTHGPPSAVLADRVQALGVDYILSGHTHTNRVIDHDGLVELNTEPFLMGGLDFTPGGYRVVTIDRGVLTSEHRTTVDRPGVALIAPAQGQCLPPGGGALIATSELAASEAVVTATIDCGTPIALAYAGGWAWRAQAPALAPGPHAVTLDGRDTAGAHVHRTVSFEVCAEEPARLAGADWPQLGGGPAHTGALAHELPPPLATAWTTPVGGHVMHGAPAIANGLVYVTVTDLAGAGGGGIVALDLATGAVRWRAPAAMPIRGAATVTGGVVAAVQIDGTVLGFDAATGAARWRYELGLDLPPKAAATYGGIAADGGDLIAGNQRRLATLDARSGRPLWVRDPVRGASEFPSLSTIAVGDDVAVGVFDRELGGVLAWDRLGADLLWQLSSDLSLSINASPVIAGGLVYLSTGATDVAALDLATGVQRWRTRLDPTGYDWAIATIGTPAIAHGVLVVPTLWRDLYALDAASGRTLWRFGASGRAELRTTHYRGAGEPGFAASPVITGDIVWAADTGGHLVALDLHSGAVLWRASLEVPVLAGLATTGAGLVVASYDGTVRALAPVAHERPPIAIAACDAPPPGGCCDARRDAGGSLLLSAAVALYALRRRRRGPARRASPSTSASVPAPAGPPALHV